MKHLFIKICLVVLACFSYLSASAYDFEADGLYFTIISLKDLTVSVDGAVNKDTDKIVIPQTVAYKNKSLTVTSVGDNAFKGYKNLQSVSFPKTVLSIGNSAFEKDILLTGVVLPDSLSEIGWEAFEGCVSLKSVSIPQRITSLRRDVFRGCKGLVSVTLNDSVKSIGDYAFYDSSIQDLDVPNSLTSIGDYAFAYSSIREIELPISLTSIGDYAFAYSSIREIELPMSLTSIGHDAFAYSKVRYVKINVKNIPRSCFSSCDSLRDVQLSENIESIDWLAFIHCKSLDNFTIGAGKIDTSILSGSSVSKLIIKKEANEFPTEFCYLRREDNSSAWDVRYFRYNSLTGDSEHNRYHGCFDWVLTTSLPKLKTVIIEDANDLFSIIGIKNGHGYIPIFFGIELNYFYVGRPLNISWHECAFYNLPVKKGHIKKLEIAGTCTKNPYFYQEIDTLILGDNIKSFVVENLYYDSLKTIVCKSTTPPSGLTSESFPTKIYTDVTLYVPKGCKDVYSNDPGWGTFWDIQEFEGDSYISAVANVIDKQRDITITTQKGSILVNNAPRNTLVQVYNLQGTLIAKSHEGVINGLSKGAYLITIGAKTFKIVL